MKVKRVKPERLCDVCEDARATRVLYLAPLDAAGEMLGVEPLEVHFCSDRCREVMLAVVHEAMFDAERHSLVGVLN